MDELPLDHQILETVRQRLNNITKNIDGYYRQTFQSPNDNEENTGLPSWNNINHAHTTFLADLKRLEDFLQDRDLQSQNYDARKYVVRSELGARRKFLEETHVFPTGRFPVQHAGLMEMLLRKRLDPQVESWVERERKAGEALDADAEEGGRMGSAEWVDLWNYAAIEGQSALQQVFLGGVEGADVEEEDDDEEMEDEEEEDGLGGQGGGRDGTKEPQMPLEYALAHMASGYVPPEQQKG